jgi:hypothetical protein
MRRLLLTAVLAAGAMGAPVAAAAQTPEHDAAYAVITTLFDGMRTRDTASMRAAFAPGASLQSVGPNGQLRADPIDGWIGSVASAPAGLVLDERLGTPIVQVSGNLATVWVDYWFFAGDRFSHCGVDAFVLAKMSGSWRILSVADTRQREGCAAAPSR